MELYIKGIGSISPSENFENISHTPEIKLVDDVYKYYFCIEPIYKEIINPLLLRRMSRAMKMGIASALLCLKDAKIETPDAIITATGLGCVDDSDKFLTSLIENEEKMLNPT
ncbi:MAG: 3-oxoacyl-ACP synthase, partial [Bacteroidetes bacterium CG_4_8_14_3_um_filter_31_14]